MPRGALSLQHCKARAELTETLCAGPLVFLVDAADICDMCLTCMWVQAYIEAFSQSLDAEVREFGVRVQNQAPMYVPLLNP